MITVIIMKAKIQNDLEIQEKIASIKKTILNRILL